MKTWKEIKLGTVCLKITDGAHASPPTVDSGLPMASVKDLTNYGITLESCRHISNSDFQMLKKSDCTPQIGDVLIAKDGNSAINTVCTIKKEIEVVLLSSIAIIRPDKKKLNSSYLKQLLSWSSYKNYLKLSFTTGAAIPRVIVKDFKACKIPLPPLPIQKKIAAVLSAYDDLIENNNRRIALLEKMAEELYREWFVRLRFPGHDNVKIIKGVPEGWEVGIIGNLFNVKSGYAFKSDDLGDMGHPIIKITNIQNGFIDKVDVQRFSGNIHKRIAQFELMDGDFLIAMTGAQVGKTGLFMMSKERFFLNQRVGKFFHRLINDNNIIFIKIFCQTNYFKSQIENYAIGAAQPNISGAQIESIKILIPTENLLKRFSLLTKPFLQKIFSLKKQNENLILFRDCLLSRLMSGKIDTENLDIRFPKSMMEEEGHG